MVDPPRSERNFNKRALAFAYIELRYYPAKDVCVGEGMHVCVSICVLLCLANFANSVVSSLHESYVNELVAGNDIAALGIISLQARPRRKSLFRRLGDP